MTRLALNSLAVAFFLFIAGSSLAAQIATDIKEQEANQRWGSIRDGIRARLTVDKSTYTLGQDIPLHIALENVSVAADVHNGFESITLTILNDDGPLRFNPGIMVGPGPPVFSGPVLCPTVYTRGKPVTLEKTLRQFGFAPDKPGIYKLLVTWTPYEGDGQPCPPSAGPTSKRYTAATSNPVFLKITAGSPFWDRKLLSSEYTGWEHHFSLVDTTFGEKTALMDDATGLEWLRLNFTAEKSYEHVVEELQPGGRFEGWRLATPEEVRRFFAHFTGTRDGHSYDEAMARKFQRLLGGPLTVPIPSIKLPGLTKGFVGQPIGPDNNMIHYHVAYIEDSAHGFAIRPDDEMSAIPGYLSPEIATFLVRVHVPFPRKGSG